VSTDHPGLPFVQAKFYGRGRPDGPPLWIVMHDMEASEYSGRAESTAAYFANPGDGRVVSSHYCVDDDSVVQCVALADVAYTVGNRPGNNRGINWELAGFARQTRDEWLDPFGRAMFARMAPYVRADATRYSIPLERRSVAELQAKRKGITSHNDLRLAFGVTDHTDPGPAFPWDYLIALLNGATEEDDVKQMLVRFADADDPNQVWLCDGMLRRKVEPEWVDDASIPGPGNGPITNAQAHQALLLGNLSNNGGVFTSIGDPDVWGVEYPQPIVLDDATMARLLAGTAAAAERGAEQAIDGATIQVGEG